jgi:Cd2+/Zn2+-exporting ATPase
VEESKAKWPIKGSDCTIKNEEVSMSECASKGSGCAVTPIAVSEPKATLAASGRAVFRIDNMDCPTEEALIRDKLSGLPGVAGLEFNLMQRTLALSHDLPTLAPVERALAAIGMKAVRVDGFFKDQTTLLAIAKMDCPTEEALIRGKLAGMPGVLNLDFNLVQRTLRVNRSGSEQRCAKETLWQARRCQSAPEHPGCRWPCPARLRS